MLNVQELQHEASVQSRSPMHLMPAEQMALKMALQFGDPDYHNSEDKKNGSSPVTSIQTQQLQQQQ